MNICPYCGKDYRFQPSGAPVTTSAAGKSHALLIVVVVIVAVAVVLAAIALALFANESKADITIDIYSTHILYSVDYTLYVNGKAIDSDTLPASHMVTYEYTYRWASSDPTTITISATSTGGGFGSQSDYADLTVSNGGAYSVSLYI
jgi:hypothetical protein